MTPSASSSSSALDKRLARIRQIGRLGHLLSGIALILVALGVVIVCGVILAGIGARSSMSFQFGPLTYLAGDLSAAGLGARVLWCLFMCIVGAYTIWGLCLLRRLFAFFRDEVLFGRGMGRQLLLLGVWCLVGALSLNFHFLLTGLLLLALGHVMELAAAIKEEQSLTI